MAATSSTDEISKPSGGATSQPAYIELYSGWATARKGGFLYGRVHKGNPLPLPGEGAGLEEKLHETIKALELRAIPNAQVRLSGLPEEVFFTADGNGFLEVRLPEGMRPGTLSVTARLETPNYTAESASTTLQVVGVGNTPIGVISDIDDTLTDSRVTNKVALVWNTLFHDTYDVTIFPKAAEAIVAIAGKGPSLLPTLPVFYLSGSPWALHERISGAFDLRGLPHGAMILRRYSQEPLDPFNFKLPHLREIVDANPGYKWVLFGDTGEKDPEVYHALMQERPDAVEAVFIHNVTGANPQDTRVADFTVFSEWGEVLRAIQERKLGLPTAQ
jgi:phosphatidate phosphatase APP1